MTHNWNLGDRIIIDCFPDVIGLNETGNMKTLQKRLMLHTDVNFDWERFEYRSLFADPPFVSDIGYLERISVRREALQN